MSAVCFEVVKIETLFPKRLSSIPFNIRTAPDTAFRGVSR